MVLKLHCASVSLGRHVKIKTVPTPRVSDSIGIEQGLRTWISNNFLEKLMLPVWRPLLENQITCPNLLSQQMAESGGICIQVHGHPKPAFLPSTLVLIWSFPIGFLVSVKYSALSVLHTVYFPSLKSEHIYNKLPLASQSIAVLCITTKLCKCWFFDSHHPLCLI